VSEARVEETRGLAGILRSPLFWACLLLLALGSYTYYPLFFPPTIHRLAAQSEEFFFEVNEAAGAPVLILSLWLFYRRSHYRDVLRGPGAPLASGIALLSSAALFAWGGYTRAPDLQLASVIGLLLGIVLLLGGRAGFRAFWLPILFIAFALPVSPVLIAATIYPIQLLTAQYAGMLLNGMGVASVVQGDQILRPENVFVVIETCSGVRTMLTLSMLTILLIDLFERRGWHALILIGLAPIVAFLTNGGRVVTLVLNPHSSIHSIHNLQGIVMLLVGLTTIYLIDGRLEWMLGSRDANVEAGDYGMTHGEGSSMARRTFEVLGVALLLVVMLALDRFVPTWQAIQALEEKPNELLARVFGEDPRAPYRMDYNFVGSVRYLAHARHAVEIDGARVEVHLGVANERKREYSILTKRLAWPETGYAPIEERFEEIVAGGPIARRMVLRHRLHSVLSYSWIERRRSLPVEWFRNALALDRSPLVRPAHMLAIRLSTKLASGALGMAQGEERIRRVWARLAPELIDYASLPSDP
jgi:exosortase